VDTARDRIRQGRGIRLRLALTDLGEISRHVKDQDSLLTRAAGIRGGFHVVEQDGVARDGF
jgi:hypothetical protein